MTEVKTKQIDDNEVTKRLVKDETDNKTDDDDKLSSIKLFRKRLNEDTFFRQKFAIFVCICYSFLITVSRMQRYFFLIVFCFVVLIIIINVLSWTQSRGTWIYSSTCIWSINLSVDTKFQSLWFLSGFP